jgi:hypothetical protein
MDDDQIGALRDFVSAAYHYLTAPKIEAPARRVELCEAVGALLFALEGPLPDDDPDGNDPDRPDTEPAAKEPSRLRPRLIKPPCEGATVIPLYGVRPRRSQRPTRDRR